MRKFCNIAHCNWSFFWWCLAFSFSGIWILEQKDSSNPKIKYPDAWIRNPIIKVLYSQNLDEWTTQFDFDNLHCWAKQSFSSGGWYSIDIFSECILNAYKCLFIVEEEGIIFHFCLACSDFYTKDFIHSISIDNMIHPINCEHAWTWNLKFSKNFSVPSQAQVLGSTWPLDH